MISQARVTVTCEGPSCPESIELELGELPGRNAYDESNAITELKEAGWIIYPDEEDADIGNLTTLCSDKCDEEYHDA